MDRRRDCNFRTEKLAEDRYKQTCLRCGHKDETTTERLSKTCKVQGWGWKLAQWLRKFGITEERYAAARGRKRICGGMNCYFVDLQPQEPGCYCGNRQAWLDYADDMARATVNRLWPTSPPTSQ